MQSPPISQSEIDARIGSHIDELLELWWAEQGASKPTDLELIASAIPFPRSDSIRALDLCCGPGDVGRAIRQVYPNAHIDFIDPGPVPHLDLPDRQPTRSRTRDARRKRSE